MPGISGHADVNGLIDWIKAFGGKPKKVFVTHGDDEVTEIFARRLNEELGLDSMAPFSGTIYDLRANSCIYGCDGTETYVCYPQKRRHSKQGSGSFYQRYSVAV